jgi:hypothetical protein
MELDPSKIYCIGGIVDRTTKNNVTKSWAVRPSPPPPSTSLSVLPLLSLSQKYTLSS